MNNFEIIRIFNKMIDNTRSLKVYAKLCYVKERLIIDKNRH